MKHPPKIPLSQCTTRTIQNHQYAPGTHSKCTQPKHSCSSVDSTCDPRIPSSYTIHRPTHTNTHKSPEHDKELHTVNHPEHKSNPNKHTMARIQAQKNVPPIDNFPSTSTYTDQMLTMHLNCKIDERTNVDFLIFTSQTLVDRMNGFAMTDTNCTTTH